MNYNRYCWAPHMHAEPLDSNLEVASGRRTRSRVGSPPCEGKDAIPGTARHEGGCKDASGPACGEFLCGVPNAYFVGGRSAQPHCRCGRMRRRGLVHEDDRVETTTLPSHMRFAAAVSSSHASGRTQPFKVS